MTIQSTGFDRSIYICVFVFVVLESATLLFLSNINVIGISQNYGALNRIGGLQSTSRDVGDHGKIS